MSRLYTGGTFDLFHVGHVNYLRECNRFGEVWVSLNTDKFAARYKRPPILTLDERITLVAACKWVAGVVVNLGDEDSRPAILSVKPRYIAHADDWTGERLMRQMGFDQGFLDEHGIEMVYVPYSEGISTSDILSRCRIACERAGASSDFGEPAVPDTEAR